MISQENKIFEIIYNQNIIFHEVDLKKNRIMNKISAIERTTHFVAFIKNGLNQGRIINNLIYRIFGEKLVLMIKLFHVYLSGVLILLHSGIYHRQYKNLSRKLIKIQALNIKMLLTTLLYKDW